MRAAGRSTRRHDPASRSPSRSHDARLAETTMIPNSRFPRWPAVVVLASLPTLLSSAGLTTEQSGARSPRARTSAPAARTFHVEEATIADVHRAIQEGTTTCRAIVQPYIERARAYNGTCTQLVTRDGGPITAGPGAVRAGSAVSFPASTTSVGSVLPTFEQYAGPPIDVGRMEATSSDPAVYQQYGMVIGLRNVGRINALSTLNSCGERRQSCKAQSDAPTAPPTLPRSRPHSGGKFRKPHD